MLQLRAGMHQPLEKTGSAERGVKTQMSQPEKAGFPSICHDRNYLSLIQDQTRELTRLRQKMRIGRTISSHLLQHVRNTVKTFEELLSSNKVECYMEVHFREQLAKGSQLAESLASKFSMDDCTSKKSPEGQVWVTLSILREMQKKEKVPHDLSSKKNETWDQAPLQIHRNRHTQPTDNSLTTPDVPASFPKNHSESRASLSSYSMNGITQLSKTPEPGHHGSNDASDEMRPQKMNASGILSSFYPLYQPKSKPSGTDILEENLVEIQNLRKRLEESVYLNDRLQERLEHVLSNGN